MGEKTYLLRGSEKLQLRLAILNETSTSLYGFRRPLGTVSAKEAERAVEGLGPARWGGENE